MREYLAVPGGKADSMSGMDRVPRRSALRLAVGSYTVCLYHPLSCPHTNPCPYFLLSPCLPPPPRLPCAIVGRGPRQAPGVLSKSNPAAGDERTPASTGCAAAH